MSEKRVRVKISRDAPLGPPPNLTFYQCLECGRYLEKDQKCEDCNASK